MDCNAENIKEMLSSYGEQAADGRTRELVEEHLASCEDCRAELSLIEMMREEEVPDPGDAFWSAMPARVYAAVHEQKSQKKAFDLTRLGNWLTIPRWGWAAAATMIVLLSVWFFIVPHPLQQDDPHVFSEVYDHGYGSIHDPTLAYPSTNMSDLSAAELDTVSDWANTELSRMATEAEPVVLNGPDHELSDELTDLNRGEIERLSKMLKEYYEEG